VNNNEMGILIQRSDDSQLYKDAYEEAQRIIRISEEVRISMERVVDEPIAANMSAVSGDEADAGDKLPSGKLAQKLGLKAADLLSRATENGYLMLSGDKHVLTPKGEKAGVEFVAKGRFGPYFLWPQDFHQV
jgi:hypothetical protein